MNIQMKAKEVVKRTKQTIWAYLEESYVPKVGKWDTPRTKVLKMSMYGCIALAFFWCVFGLGHFVYAAKLFATYPMPVLDNNYALELSILGGIWLCFSLFFWGAQYVINYYRSRWLDPDAKEIIDEQHYMKFHGWSHIVLALMLILGICLVSLELLTYPNAKEMPQNLDGLKMSMVLLVMIYGTCRLHAHKFKEYIDQWKGKA